MPLLLISLIGSPGRDYQETEYVLDDGTRHVGRYHQDLLLRHLFPEGAGPDRFWLVSTQEALNTHAHRLAATPRQIAVPSGFTNEELWRVYAAVADPLLELADRTQDGEPVTIHLDLTHGWRILPTFVLAAVRTCCALRPQRLEMGDIWYAFFDPSVPRPSDGWPLRRVTPIAAMADIAADVRLFLDHGIASPLADRLQGWDRALVQHLRATARALRSSGDPRPEDAIVGDLRRQHPDLAAARPIATALSQLATAIQLNHTPHLPSVVAEIQARADRLRSDAIATRPMVQALRTAAAALQVEMPGASEPLWRWHLAQARWCLRRGLLQQAVTHAAELTVTRLCEELGADPLDHHQRERYSRILSAFEQGDENRDTPDKRIAPPEAWKPWIDAHRSLHKSVRNVINHAAMSADGVRTKSDRLHSSIQQAIDELVRLHEGRDRLPPWRDLLSALNTVLVVDAREAWALIQHPVVPFAPPCHIPWHYEPRSQAEIDPGWLQVIPYALLCRGRQVWAAYRRSGDPRLVGRRTVGFGGHIGPEDDGADLVAIARQALRRELAEELVNPPPDAAIPAQPLAWISEGATPVGRVHIGLVWAVIWPSADDPRLTADSGLEAVGFIDCDAVTEAAGYETWSSLACLAWTRHGDAWACTP